LFGIAGELSDVQPLGGGHIHETYLATYRSHDGARCRVVHQRVNSSVFTDSAILAANLERVTAHLGARAAGTGRRTLRLFAAVGGGTTAGDADGAMWRTLGYIEGTRTVACFESPAQAREAAAAAARLVSDLAELPGGPLPEVIAGFHDVVGRVSDLDRAVTEDCARRARGCRSEVQAVLTSAGLADDVRRARDDGRLPQRTVHNDAKAENILFDRETGAAVCLVDLDTVGPGTVLFDVGDLVRSGATTGPEDHGPDTVAVRADVVDAIGEGYAEAGAGFLRPSEVELFPLAGPLMALESAARFLTDHLRGDVYFAVDRPDHNLHRARNQLRVLELLS
jgi:hypothetical protein